MSYVTPSLIADATRLTQIGFPGAASKLAVESIRNQGASDAIRQSMLYASKGAIVPGHDTTGSDDVPAMVTRGEAVLPVRTVDAIGGPEAVRRLIERTNGATPDVGLRRGGKHADGVVPKEKEKEKQVVAGASEAKPGQPRQPTGNLREFYQAQTKPVANTIRAGVERAFPYTVEQGRDMQAKVGQAYEKGGFISAAAEAQKRVAQPAIGVLQDVGSAVGEVGKLLNPFSRAGAQSAPSPTTPAAPVIASKPWAGQAVNKATQPQSAATSRVSTPPPAPSRPAAKRPTISAQAQAPVSRPAQPVAQPAAQPQADDSVIIDRGIGPPGSTIAMVDNNTGRIWAADGGTDVYRPFEGQYVTEGQRDAITAGRMKIGDPGMTVGQAGAISKSAALLAERSMSEAGATKRTEMTTAASLNEAKLRESGLWGRHNSAIKATEQQNKLREEMAKLDLALLADPTNDGIRAKRAALTGKSALIEKDILDSYTKLAESGAAGDMSYQEYRASIVGGGGAGVTKEQVDEAAAAKGITDPAQLKQLYKTYGVQ